jgi:molybdate transport repressor ModE-like protein
MAVPLDIRLRPVWRFRGREERELDLSLLALLEAIEHTGKLTAAAQIAGMSHRHAWNLIERWSELLGAPLVTIERGRGTQLSPLGAKLLWAGKRTLARLEPELDNLAAELAETLGEAVPGNLPVLRIHASHDFALAKLRQLAAESRALAIDLRYRGSAETLASLRRGSCDLAGFHVTEGPLGIAAASRYLGVLGPDVHRLVWLANRVQGLIVAPGNPKGLHAIADLAKPGVRLINRQRDSGTRILLDQLLGAAGIDPSALEGHENEEHTHGAVAAHVAGGLADVGLGIEAAARQLHLDFVPVATERYFLAAHRDTLERPEAKYFVGLLRGDAFHDVVAELHGERAHRTGEIAQLRDTPPWDKLL